jgi:PAS domain S-box-containing protein
MIALKRHWPAIAFGTALALLAGMSALAYFSVEKFVDRADWILHTQDVLRETDAMLFDLSEIENGVRGFVITGDDSFLAPHLGGLTLIPARLRMIEGLTGESDAQQKRVHQLQREVQERLQKVAQLLESNQKRRLPISEDAARRIAAGESAMITIRSIAGDLRLSQEQLLAARVEDSRRGAVTATAILIAGTLAGVAALILAFVILRRQIDQRTRSEQAARASALEAMSLYNDAPCGYHSVDKDGYFTHINNTSLGWLGYKREDLVGKKRFVDIVAPQDTDRAFENFAKLRRGELLTNIEYHMVRKDGSSFPASINVLPVLDENGKFLLNRTTMFDISVLHAARSKLEDTSNFLDVIIENIPSMLFVKDATTLRYVRINRSNEKLLGISRENVIGKNDFELFSKEQAESFNTMDRKVLAASEMMTTEEALSTPNGRRVQYARKLVVRDASGKPLYLLGITDDITAQKNAEEAIRALNVSLEARADQLQIANKELESFSYSVSHDLRAPLRAIAGFSRIFEEDYGDRLDNEGRRLLKVIRDNSHRMGTLIDDLLAFSRLGRQALTTQKIDMKGLATSVIEELRTSGIESNVTIGDLPHAKADPALLKQVWVNLLSNAIKYSGKNPSPQIDVGVQAPNGHGEAPVYYVKDNGVGFDMQYQNKLFGVFQRLHRDDEFAGTGVGLAIVHRVVTRHGGKIWAEAEVGKGATFYFTLPEVTEA